MNLEAEIKKRRPFDSPQQEAYLGIARTHGVLGGPLNQLLKAHGLSEAAYNILRILRGAYHWPVDGRKSLSCHEIGQRMVTRLPDITRLLDRLEQSSLIERQRSVEDRRVVETRITRRGLALLARLDQPLQDLHKQTLGELTRTELKQLVGLLTKARAGVLAADD